MLANMSVIPISKRSLTHPADERSWPSSSPQRVRDWLFCPGRYPSTQAKITHGRVNGPPFRGILEAIPVLLLSIATEHWHVFKKWQSLLHGSPIVPCFGLQSTGRPAV